MPQCSKQPTIINKYFAAFQIFAASCANIPQRESYIAADFIENTIPEFRGTLLTTFEAWFEGFETIAMVYNFTDIQMLVYAKNKMSGNAKFNRRI